MRTKDIEVGRTYLAEERYEYSGRTPRALVKVMETGVRRTGMRTADAVRVKVLRKTESFTAIERAGTVLRTKFLVAEQSREEFDAETERQREFAEQLAAERAEQEHRVAEVSERMEKRGMRVSRVRSSGFVVSVEQMAAFLDAMDVVEAYERREAALA